MKIKLKNCEISEFVIGEEVRYYNEKNTLSKAVVTNFTNQVNAVVWVRIKDLETEEIMEKQWNQLWREVA
jgi:hypothetical protein